MEMFIVTPHSVVDVMTNSSSEIFIIETKKKVGVIKEWLQKLLEAEIEYSRAAVPFEKVFKEPFIIKTKEQALEVYRETIGWDGMQEYVDIQLPVYDWDASHKDKSYFEKHDVEEKKVIDDPENVKKAVAKLMGKLIIYSYEDNSIPWGIVSNIESTTNAMRIHLG